MLQITLGIMLLLVAHSAISAATMGPVSIPENGEIGTCPAQESRDMAIQNVRASVLTIIRNNLTSSNMAVSPSQCGARQWYRVAYLSGGSIYNNITNRVRGCRKPESSSPSCSGTFYPTSRQYSRVCERAIGYQIGSTDAFGDRAIGQTINSYYVWS